MTDEQRKNGVVNQGFEEDVSVAGCSETNASASVKKVSGAPKEREQWGNDREFLMSCIAMSIGLGNVWRFPFTAYENGGGAFLIPYIIILITVGRPFYLLEMTVGQFSSESAVKIWAVSPAFKGVGFAQLLTMIALASYYCSLMALTLFYLIGSFQYELPWAKCRDEWGKFCMDSASSATTEFQQANSSYRSSAELYFYKEVLRERDSIDEGIGTPDWRLALCLVVSWTTVFGVLIRGVKSSGKASYFLALFPYVVMIGLLIRAVTLPGAGKGIMFLISPDWDKLWEPTVWYAAVSQCFFSLTVGFGAVIMFSSHNRFDHKIYKDAMIVTTLDTFTSLLAGCTIFGILGNLAHELGADDISTVVRGGTGLAFISYPEAIAKFSMLPQLFAVLFFTMMFVLGVGSEAGLTAGITSIIKDQFPSLKSWQVTLGVCLLECSIGLIYVTPGGQYMITFVDYYATSFIAFVLATFEMAAIFWVYGLENFVDDVEFMLKKRLSVYWRLCWGIVTPIILTIIFFYTIATLKPLTYANVSFPDSAYIVGWTLFSFGLMQLPIWMLVAILKKRNLSFYDMVLQAFQPSKQWGPKGVVERKQWQQYKEIRSKNRHLKAESAPKRAFNVLFGLDSI